jgi:hypothetical protein
MKHWAELRAYSGRNNIDSTRPHVISHKIINSAIGFYMKYHILKIGEHPSFE